MKSSMKAGSEKREKEWGVEACPYSQAHIKTIHQVLIKFDTILSKHPEYEKSINEQKYTYIRHFFLMNTLYPLFDTWLKEREQIVFSYLQSIEFQENMSLQEKNYFLRVYAMKVYLYIFAKGIHKKVSSEQTSFDFRFDDYIKDFSKTNNTPLYKAWKIIFDLNVEDLYKESPEKYIDDKELEKILYSFLREAYIKDIDDGFLHENSFEGYENFLIHLQQTFIGNEKQPLFLNLIASYGTSFQILYAMIGSICEELMEYEEFRILSNQDKYQMLRSIKRDFLVEARFWSLYFLNDNQDINQFTNMLWFTPTMSTMPRGKILMDFENLELALDESTYPNNPLGEGKIIRRGCPIVFVSGENLGGNFLARQIDFVIDVHAKIALGLEIK